MLIINRFIKYIITILFISIIFSMPRKGHVELGIGLHQPQAEFDKYVDGGLCFRFLTSLNITPLINLDLGAQFLNFRHDSYQDNFVLENGGYGWGGPPVEISNSEQAAILLAGPRIMSPSKIAFIRPYIAIKGGIFFFNETTTWEMPWANSENGDYDSYTNVVDSRMNLGWLLDIGSNFAIGDRTGVDINIQYCIIPGLEKPVMNYSQDEEGNSTFENVTFSQKIDADYITIHIGLTIPFKDI